MKEEDSEGYVHTAVLGYVFKLLKKPMIFNSHIGRDITARSLRHFRG